MPVPTNTTAATAIDIGTVLPYSTTQNVNFGGTTYGVWYKYTAQPGDTSIGVFGFGDLVAYTVDTTMISTDGVLPSISSVNKAVQLPVVVGQTYSFRFVSDTGNVATAVLTLSVRRAPKNPAPATALLINDDTDGFPAAVLSPLDGVVLRFVQPFPASEHAHMLPSGVLLILGNGPLGGNGVFIYSATLTKLLGPLTISFASPALCSSDGAATFYIAGAVTNTPNVTTIASATGVQGPTVWQPTLQAGAAMSGMAPSTDNTILYYYGSGNEGLVRRWDLIANVALSNLAGVVTGYKVGTFGSTTNNGLLVLSDGTVLVPYYKTDLDTLVKHYSAAGVVLATYSFTQLLNTLCSATDDPLSFNVWIFNGGLASGKSQFQNVRISDGVLVRNTGDVAEFEIGAYLPAVTATPTARFGHSQSCPMVTLRSALLDPGCTSLT